MRRAVEVFIRGLLRSRVGVAVVLAVVVFGVVGAAKLSGTSTDAIPGTRGAPDQPIITANPTIADDGLATPDSVPAPVTSPGTAAPATVAEAFGRAWVAHHNVTAERWYAGLLPHCTTTLAEKLADVDPAAVPADRLTSKPVLIPYAENIVDATIRVDSGLLRLRLATVDGRWLVDGVDWERV